MSNANIDWMLTDEFVNFSAKIKEVHEKKQAKKQELKAFYENISGEMKLLDNEAAELAADFNKKYDAFKNKPVPQENVKMVSTTSPDCEKSLNQTNGDEISTGEILKKSKSNV